MREDLRLGRIAGIYHLDLQEEGTCNRGFDMRVMPPHYYQIARLAPLNLSQEIMNAQINRHDSIAPIDMAILHIQQILTITYSPLRNNSNSIVDT